MQKPSTLRQGQADGGEKLRTKLCKFDKQPGGCPHAGCWFAHSAEQLQSSNPLFKTMLCSTHEAAPGSCNRGDECNFAHGQGQLRAPPGSTALPQVAPIPEARRPVVHDFGEFPPLQPHGTTHPPERPPAAPEAPRAPEPEPPLAGPGPSAASEPPPPPNVLDELRQFDQEALPKLCRQTRMISAHGLPLEKVTAVLPVQRLRWTHDGINAHMTFGQGRRQDSSIYEVVHDLFSERLKPTDIPPLQVVLDGNKLFSLNNRRLAALKMYQALRQHEVIRVPCEVYQPDDPRIKLKYQDAKSTGPQLGDGLGIKLHGDRQEARHMGAPLFRRSQEWCDVSPTATAVAEHVGDAGPMPASTVPSTATPLRKPPPPPPPKDSPVKLAPAPKTPAKASQPPLAESLHHDSLRALPETVPKAFCKATQCFSHAIKVPPLPSASPSPTTISEVAAAFPKARPSLPQAPEQMTPEAPRRSQLSQDLFETPAKCRQSVIQAPVADFAAQEPAHPANCGASFEPEQLATVLADAEHRDASSDSELSCRSESDDDDNHMWGKEEDDEKDEKNGSCQDYPSAAALEMELSEQKNIRSIADLKGKLICGTFRCLSGADFKHRRCRGQVMVETGPKAMLGCRVHIQGGLNRNRAWDFDKCWVRILNVRVTPGQTSSAAASWDASLAEATVLMGQVVRAEQQGYPRQALVVCLRSKFVRSLRCMVFRPVNGKFPLIRVPWTAQQELPSGFDLHVVEVRHWKNVDFPAGRYVEVLNMQRRNTDVSVLFAVQRSLNFCDWELPEVRRPAPGPPVPSVQLTARNSSRRDLSRIHPVAVSIEHEGWPVSVAFSMPNSREVHIHLADVNEYLEACTQVHGEELDRMALKRAVGAWFTDYLDCPVQACLPLMPAEMETQTSFAAGVDRPALTIVLQVDQASGDVDVSTGKHFESVVRCSKVFAYAEAEACFSDPSSTQSKEAELLRALSKVVAKIEHAAFKRGSSVALEHWEPELGPRPCTSSHAARLVSCLSYLANAYAGEVLARPKLWEELQAEDASLRKDCLMPMFAYGRPDTLSYRCAQRTLGLGFADAAGITVEAATKVLREKLAAAAGNSEQQHALQKALLRQVCNSLPAGCYLLDKVPSNTLKVPRAWPPAGSTKGAPHQKEGHLFKRARIFHVTAPMRRYIDILGHRALKLAAGWKPPTWLQPTAAHLAEAVMRTTARLDANRFAAHIFRQITVMRDLNHGSWRVENALVGNVGPASFEVLVPLPSSTHMSLSVPVSALRGAACMVEFEAESQSLKVSCFSHAGCQALPQGCASWRICPWGLTRLSCTVSRNFAHPVPHHASANAYIPSDVAFEAKAGQRSVEVCLGVGHRMYPEVFSEWPDLSDFHLLTKDINAYARIWYAARTCQTHAAATASVADTPRTCARGLKFHTLHDKQRCQCKVTWPGSVRDDLRISKGDLAIVRCAVPSGSDVKEVILYGKVESYRASQDQVNTRLCSIPGCKSPKCHFAHSEEDLQPATFVAEVELSKISMATYKAQQRLLEEAEQLDDGAFDVQFITIPFRDRRNLERVQSLPQLLRSKGGTSPIAPYLIGLQAPQQKQTQQEIRPLASCEQVKVALSRQDFTVKSLPLNDSQLRAIECGLQRPFSLVQGPPGTGKTTFLMHMVTAILNLESDPTLEAWQQVNGRKRQDKAQEPGKILVCTPSNQAADECLRRLVQESDIPHQYITRIYARSIEAQHGSRFQGGALIDGRKDFTIRGGLEEYALHYKVLQQPNVRTLESALGARGTRSPGQRHYDSAYESHETTVLKGSRVIVTTCDAACAHTSLCKNNGQRTINFATVIVDEAAQATEPDVVLPALLAEQRVVIVGDHRQLGPVVPERNLCRAHQSMLETPMLERLYNMAGSTMLEIQYRMHPSIRCFPSRRFYESRLQDDIGLEQRLAARSIWPHPEERVTFIDSHHPHAFGMVTDVGYGRSMTATLIENNTSVQNEGEAKLVVEVYVRLLQDGVAPRDIAILTPYRAQQQLIEKKLGELRLTDLGAKIKDTAVGTVYALQGSERAFVVLSLVRSTAEGYAIAHGPFAAASAADIRVSVGGNSAALRQSNETNLGMVSKSQLLNVALTRAKCGLVIIGNRLVLSEGSDDMYYLARHLADRGCILTEAEFRSLG